ncbi:FeoA family protein [Sphingosinicella soli]|uniref:Ferrous iron transport protein A n=1 Tax=Sphingosinicella soli TaxID=333708 RepID=A0A7W7B3P3_9SPHN|nr:FeoA family protein [Sphingosinicella soli]MBB4632475.1 ferrous iron transport protein A [Sphingosinicella soli]
MRIEDLKAGQTASVVTIRETGADAAESVRLREMGFDEGVEIELLHRGLIGGCPIALRVGSNVIALRKAATRLLDVRLVTSDIQAEAAE